MAVNDNQPYQGNEPQRRSTEDRAYDPEAEIIKSVHRFKEQSREKRLNRIQQNKSQPIDT